MRDGVKRLHRRMRDDRHIVSRFDHLGGRGHRRIDVAIMAGHRALLVERIDIGLAELRAVGRAGGADLPLDRNRVECGLGPEVAIGHHRDGILEFDHLQVAAAAGDGALVDRLHRSAEHRTGHNRRLHHVRHRKIDAVHRRAIDLQRHIEPCDPLADELERIGRLDRRLLVELDRGGFGRELAEAESAAGRLVRDLAHRRHAVLRRHVPAFGRRGDQSLARARAGLLDHLASLTHGAAAASAQAAIDFIIPEIAIGGSVFGLHKSPVAFELLGEDLRQRGEAALPHLGAAVADDHAVVGIDHDPGVDLARIARSLIAPRANAQGCGFGALANANAKRKAAGGGDRGGDERATGKIAGHDAALPAHVRISAAA